MSHLRAHLGSVLAVALAALVSGCGDDLVLPAEGEPARITAFGGDGQAGPVGNALSQALVAEVTDSRGRPVQGEEVVFSIDGGGGQVTPGSALTDAAGHASANWTLGPLAGTQRVRAMVAGSSSASLAVLFSATAVAGTGQLLELVAGDGQVGSVSSPLPNPLVVRAKDGNGNPVSGVQVTWTASGGGSIEPATVSTDADGLASAQRILGPASGGQSAQAEAPGLAGSPITFVHTATATTASALAFVQEPLNGSAGANLVPAVRVAVRDAQGNTVTSANTSITLTLGANPGGATLSGTLTVDAVAGVATFPDLKLDKVGNGYTLVADGGGLPSATSAAFDIVSGTGNRLVFTADPSNAVVGAVITPAVQVTVQDVGGNPVTSFNGQVTLVIGENPGSATISPSPARVNAVNGVATFTNLRLNHVGSGYTLIALGSGLANDVSQPFDITQASTTTSITSKSPGGASVVGQPVTVNFDVEVAAPGSGTPAGSVTVSDGAQSCVGTVAAGSCSITFNSAGSRNLTATYAGNNDFGSSTSGNTSHQVNQANTNVTITSDNPDPSAIGDPVTVAFTVTVNSPGGGTPTGDVTVTMSGGSESCAASISAGSCVITPLAAGNRTLTATYNGDANYNGDTDNENHSIRTETETAVSSSGNTVFGQSVTFTATVTSDGGGTPTGSVQFKANGANIDGPAALSGGTATRSTSSLPVGNDHVITAEYIPTGSFLASTGTLSGGHDVSQAGTTTTITADSPDPSNESQPYTVTVTVAAPGGGAPSGSVLISDSESPSCTATLNGSGTGSCQLSTPTAGAKTLTAEYGGGPNHLASTAAPVPHQVNALPIANNDAYSVGPLLPTFIPAGSGVLVNDSDPDAFPSGLSAVLQDNVDSGALLLNGDGSFLYTPDPTVLSGSTSFTYLANDGLGNSVAVGTVTITIGP